MDCSKFNKFKLLGAENIANYIVQNMLILYRIVNILKGADPYSIIQQPSEGHPFTNVVYQAEI